MWKGKGNAGGYGLIAGLGLALGGLYPLNNNDTYGHLAQGRQIAELGHIPSVDLFSFWKATPQPWHNYEWLYDILTWWIYATLGPNGLLAAKCAMLFAVGYLVVRLASTVSANGNVAWLTAVLVILAIPSVRFRLTERPHVLGIFFAAVLLYGIGYVIRTEGKRAWFAMLGLVVMHIVWVNVHGSHLFGLTLIGCHGPALLDKPKALGKLVLLGLADLAVSGVSPFGYAILTDAVEHVIRPEYRVLVSEWRPWDDSSSVYFPLSIAAALALLLFGTKPLFRSGAAARGGLFASIVMGIMAMRSLRFTAEFLLLAPPFIAAGLVEYQWVAKRFSKEVSFALAAAVAFYVSPLLPPGPRFGVGEIFVELPAGSGQFLRQRVPKARILATMAESWYLMYAVPKAKLLIDGRVPFYGPDHVKHVEWSFASDDKFHALVDEYNVDTYVADYAFKAGQKPASMISQWQDWRLVYVENWHAVYIRNGVAEKEAPALKVLPAAYEPTPILDPKNRTDVIWADLKRLGTHSNGAAYRNYIKALLLLRPLMRDGIHAGARAPASREEWMAAKKALKLLNYSHRYVPSMQTVEVYRAMAALAVCDIETVKSAIASSRERGDSREGLLVDAELAVRTSDHAKVKAFLDEASTMGPQAATDPWLAAIRADEAAGIHCKAK